MCVHMSQRLGLRPATAGGISPGQGPERNFQRCPGREAQNRTHGLAHVPGEGFA